MRYTLSSGKNIVISDTEIDKLMKSLDISQADAIDLWLSDNGYEVNEEQEKLDEKASKVKIDRNIVQNKSKKERKKPEIKVSDEKKTLFNEILTHLQSIYGENVNVLTDNKLITVQINDKLLKIDVIQARKA